MPVGSTRPRVITYRTNSVTSAFPVVLRLQLAVNKEGRFSIGPSSFRGKC
ncbi:hypothetical protein D918_00515 [Trichuris suis]|nr:hypothetical protein D918_00515 [Trichuris suis]